MAKRKIFNPDPEPQPAVEQPVVQNPISATAATSSASTVHVDNSLNEIQAALLATNNRLNNIDSSISQTGGHLQGFNTPLQKVKTAANAAIAAAIFSFLTLLGVIYLIVAGLN